MRHRVSCLLLVLSGLLLLAPASALAVTVSRAELSGSSLRVEGRGAAPNVQVRVTAIPSTHMALGTADGSGNFRVESSSFRSDSCKVDVSDGGRTADALGVTLSGCTPTTAPPPPPPPTTEPTQPPPPPPGCRIAPRDPATFHQGDLQTFSWSIEPLTGCRTSNGGMQWSLVSGRIPPGMTGPHLQGVGSGFVTGRPTTLGTYTFTIRGRDNVGATDTETFTITVVGPRPVTVTTQGFLDGRVGEAYCCGNLFSDGGTSPYTYAVTAGALPPGLSIRRFTNGTRVTGTPTTAGTYGFSITSTDSRGTRSAPKAFTLTIQPRA